MALRKVQRVVTGKASIDGAGVHFLIVALRQLRT